MPAVAFGGVFAIVAAGDFHRMQVPGIAVAVVRREFGVTGGGQIDPGAIDHPMPIPDTAGEIQLPQFEHVARAQVDATGKVGIAVRHQVDVVVAHLQRPADIGVEERRQPRARGTADDTAQQVDASRAVHRLVAAGIARHRQVQGVAVPVILPVLRLHDILVTRRFVVVVIAGQPRGHAHQIGDRDPALARIGVGQILVLRKQ